MSYDGAKHHYKRNKRAIIPIERSGVSQLGVADTPTLITSLKPNSKPYWLAVKPNANAKYICDLYVKY
jgi:hypothetical protein